MFYLLIDRTRNQHRKTVGSWQFTSPWHQLRKKCSHNGFFACKLITNFTTLPTAHCPLPTAHCPLPTVFSKLITETQIIMVIFESARGIVRPHSPIFD